MLNITFCIFWMLTYEACKCNNSFNFWNFSKFQNEVERYLVKLHFLSLTQILKIGLLKVTIKANQGTSNFRICELLGVKLLGPTLFLHSH